jgi:uncharacterized protein (DUF342 family)
MRRWTGRADLAGRTRDARSVVPGTFTASGARRACRSWLQVVFAGSLVGGSVTGCGNAIYAYQASSATSKLEEARQLGADEHATYDYTMAAEHLSKSREEAAEADYSDAIRFAETAERHAAQAVALSREAQRASR